MEPYDIFVGPTSEDAVIFFRTGNKSWTPAEIEQVDQALAILHHATENTTLLKCSSGAVMTFERASGFGAGTNSGGHIVLTDLVMNGSSTWEIGYALHEIGNNWDTESPIWGDFLNLSAWTQTDPNSPQYQKIEKYGETWWYNTNAAFASISPRRTRWTTSPSRSPRTSRRPERTWPGTIPSPAVAAGPVTSRTR